MRVACCCVMSLAGVLSPLAFAAAQEPAPLDATLRQLEKDIAVVRGLAFKSPVVAKMVPRPKDGAKGVQGYYSTKDKTLYLHDDIAGNYQRGVLVHEMVHALQDQHFGLAKLHQESFGSDAELALAALVEGDATLTMIELLKTDQPRAAAMLDVPLAKAKNLQNAFLYAQGARYVKALKERGGWEAVNARYRFPPRSTAAILNPAANIGTVDLGPGRVVGAFGIIKKLAEHPDGKELAITATAGWIGDRMVEVDGAKAWVVAFASKEQAARFHAAYDAMLKGKEPGMRTSDDAGTITWLNAAGQKLGVLLRGQHVFIVEADGEALYRAGLERLDGPPTLEIHSARDNRKITFGELVDRLLEADLICVGETHDSDLCHRVQLQIIRALHASDSRLGVGMEMFQRPFQKELDRYTSGAIGEDELLKGTEYRTRWGFDWSLYQPIADFCRRNTVPVAALNVPKELTGRLSKVGHAGLSDEEKKQLGPVDFHVKAHREHWYEQLAKMHGKAKVSEEQKERSYQVMTAWDEYMAASAAAFQKERQLRRMVVLAGSGHIDRGFGIPARAAQRTGGRAATVHVAPGGDPAKLFASPVADYTIVVR